jgi:nicotinate dehydrogenase subunit B
MATAVPTPDPRRDLALLKLPVSRLDFLKGGGALVVGFSMAGGLVGALAEGAQAAAPAPAPLPADSQRTPSVDAWLAVRPDNTVEIYQSKVEIGGGETTAIAQIAAEELDLPLSRVSMHRVQTSVTPWDAGTFGSQSVSGGGAAVRMAAATARQALLIMAAARLHASSLEQLTVRDGVIRGPGGAVTYGQLIGGQRFGVNVNRS